MQNAKLLPTALVVRREENKIIQYSTHFNDHYQSV